MQLIFANEMCFPANFKELIKKHFRGTIYEGLERTFYNYFIDKCNRNLLTFISTRSGLDDEMGAIIDGIITDLIGDYDENNG